MRLHHLKRYSSTALIAVLLLLITGCSLVSPPVVTFNKFAPVSIDTAGMDIDLMLNVKNPNSHDLTITGYSYTLTILDLPFGSGGERRTIIFTANEETIVRIPIRVEHGQLLSVIKRLPDPDKIPYTLTASLQFQTPFGEKSVPLNRKGLFPLPERYRPKTILKGLFELLTP